MSFCSDFRTPGACDDAGPPGLWPGRRRIGRGLAGTPLALGLLVAALLTPGAWAEKADRSKPMVIEADKPATVDMQRQLIVFSGNVQIAQGSLQIRADRLEVRESPDGSRSASATGGPGRPVSFRQKRDGVEEFVEGAAERIDFDGRADVLKLSGSAQVRRLRGTLVADEISGQVITWDNNTEVFNVEGAGPGSRVRAVLSPREPRPAPPPAAASAPAARGGPGRP